MKRRPSIAVRLAFGLSVMMAVLWLGAAAIAGYVMQRELASAFDEALEQSAYRLLPLAIHRVREPEETEELMVDGIDQDESYFSYFVQRPDGSVLVRVGDTPPAADIDVTSEFSDQAGRRVFVLLDPRSGFRIVVFEQVQRRVSALVQSLSGLLWPLVALIPLIGLAIWVAIRLALRPVEEISRAIKARDGANLEPIDVVEQPAELAPIAEAVDDLLARLKQALDAERAFAASSAHELRTPIAGALAHAELLQAELAGQPGERRVLEVLDSLAHLSRLTDKLLQLARLEAGFARSDVQHDLLPVVHLVVRDFEATAATADRIEVSGLELGLRSHIDMDAFAAALRNLIENALAHGSATEPVEVRVEPGNVVRVSNGGAVVSAEALANIAKPFVRGDTTADGTGLGLALVATVMRQTGGQLELRSPRSGSADGFEAKLVLG